MKILHVVTFGVVFSLLVALAIGGRTRPAIPTPTPTETCPQDSYKSIEINGETFYASKEVFHSWYAAECFCHDCFGTNLVNVTYELLCNTTFCGADEVV